MRILHVITGLPRAAGTSVFCGNMANGLAIAGHEVAAAVCNPRSSDSFPLDARVGIVAINSVIHGGLEWLPDVIHIHALWTPVLYHVSAWAHGNGTPVVWSPHGMLTRWALNSKKWKKRLAWWLYQKRALVAAEMLHATAESEVDDFRRVGLKNETMVVPLGYDIVATEGASRRVPVRSRRTLLFVSRVQKKKGLKNLVGAWAMLPESVRDSWCVRIVGPDQEGHSAEVMAECMRKGVRDDFNFVGPKYGEALSREYEDADLFVLPTHSENFGSVVVEALAHGVPVICTMGAPWRELNENRCGEWIEIGVEPLADALLKCMSMSDDERRQMGERGRRLVEGKYTWGAAVKAMVKGYEQVLTGRIREVSSGRV